MSTLPQYLLGGIAFVLLAIVVNVLSQLVSKHRPISYKPLTTAKAPIQITQLPAPSLPHGPLHRQYNQLRDGSLQIHVHQPRQIRPSIHLYPPRSQDDCCAWPARQRPYSQRQVEPGQRRGRVHAPNDPGVSILLCSNTSSQPHLTPSASEKTSCMMSQTAS